jgi:hypothetical protein
MNLENAVERVLMGEDVPIPGSAAPVDHNETLLIALRDSQALLRESQDKCGQLYRLLDVSERRCNMYRNERDNAREILKGVTAERDALAAALKARRDAAPKFLRRVRSSRYGTYYMGRDLTPKLLHDLITFAKLAAGVDE